MKKFIAIAALAFMPIVGTTPIVEAAAPGIVPAVVTPTNYTSCDQSGFLGTRVCFDDTTGFGPVGYIYSGNTTIYAAEGSRCAANAVGAFAATPFESRVTADSTTVPNWMSTFESYPIPCDGRFFTFSPGFHNQLEWVLACQCGYEYIHAK